MRIPTVFAIPAILAFLVSCSTDSAEPPGAWNEFLADEILGELIATNTGPSGGFDTRRAVALLETRLKLAGFEDPDLLNIGKTDKQRNLVVRYRSKNPIAKPVLMMAHLDVVEALPEDWTVPPFTMTEAGGYYYGRGTTDNKAGAAMLVANFIRLKNEGFEPNRDLIVMLTADEETTGDAAIWLTTEKRELIDAEFALNTDGGMVMLKGDEARAFIMQTSEKVYVSYVLEALDPGGHSSLPRPDSAITRIARALVELDNYEFPVDLNETTRAFFTQWQGFAPAEETMLIQDVLEDDSDPETVAQLEESPYYNALARTTCVATQLNGGHAENALPQSARAVINCRILPQTAPESVRSVIDAIAKLHDLTVTSIYDPRPSPPSPLDQKIMDPVMAVAQEMWPDISLIPEMSTGATDGLFVRNAGIPVYGISAIAEDPDDIRAHGQDERIGIDAFRDATEYWYRLTKTLSQN